MRRLMLRTELKTPGEIVKLRRKAGSRSRSHDERYIVLAFFVLFAIMSVFSPSFLTSYNLRNLLCTASITGIVACGMTAVMATGGIDISVGSLLGLGGALSAYVLTKVEEPSVTAVAVAILLSVLACGLLGLVNGVLTVKLRAPSLLITMGMMKAARGLVYLITGGKAVFFKEEISAYRWIGSGFVGNVPTLVVVFVVIAVAMGWILKKTVYGRYLCSIGLNANASYLSGVNVDRVALSAYVVCGLLAGLSGVILSSRLNSATPDAGVNYETLVITAIVLGGNSLTGGRASILGTVVGIFIMVMLANWLNLLGMQSIYQKIVTGGLLIIVLVVNTLTKRQSGKLLLAPSAGT